MPEITYSGSNRYVNGLYFSNIFDIKTAGGRNGAEKLIGNYMERKIIKKKKKKLTKK